MLELKYFRVRENEVLYQTALSIAYSGVFHSYINALTLFLHCANQCQLCGAYIHKYLNRKLSELQ
nr:MAG TPA: hypothetical protein [Caudoviricetes sp.]